MSGLEGRLSRPRGWTRSTRSTRNAAATSSLIGRYGEAGSCMGGFSLPTRWVPRPHRAAAAACRIMKSDHDSLPGTGRTGQGFPPSCLPQRRRFSSRIRSSTRPISMSFGQSQGGHGENMPATSSAGTDCRPRSLPESRWPKPRCWQESANTSSVSRRRRGMSHRANGSSSRCSSTGSVPTGPSRCRWGIWLHTPGFSVRAVEQAFASHVGAPPMACLRAMRLDLARRLLEAAPAGSNVTAVVLEAGINHLGRFAGAYQQRYGELPVGDASPQPGAVFHGRQRGCFANRIS